MSAAPIQISVVVCTRNRGASAAETIGSLLASDHTSFELLLIDQSTNDETEMAIGPYLADERFAYVRTPTKGLGRARNIGLDRARGAIVAFTDDDCTAPPDWLRQIEAGFSHDPRIAVVFCNVYPGEHDPKAGFIPDYVRTQSYLARTFWEKRKARGIGAGMAVRRSAMATIGGFDDLLGAGGHFPSCEDRDITVRAIALGYWVYETHLTGTIHYGFRTWEQGRDLTQRDWYGSGATYAKLLKSGRWGGIIVVLDEGIGYGLLEPLSNLLRFKSVRGFRRFAYFLQGLIAGFRHPVDKTFILFQGERSARLHQPEPAHLRRQTLEPADYLNRSGE